MAPVPLNVAPAFRPWRQAGITHLLFDEATAAQIRQASVQSRTAPAAPVEAAGPGTRRSEPHAQRAVRPSPPLPREQATVSAGTAPRSPETPRAEKNGRTPPACPVPRTTETPSHPIVAPRRLAPDRWPSYWRSLLERTPQTPEVVWTYPSLSRDLGGAAEAAHRDFLRRLLGDMGMPRGTNAFWPLNAYPYGEDGGESSVDASMFMSGIDVLNPDMVVLMCGRAPMELGLNGLGLLMPTIIRGRRFVVTPHVDDLILQPRRYAQLVTFLKGLIAGR